MPHLQPMLPQVDGTSHGSATHNTLGGSVVLPAGIEPALDYSKQILSLQRLPVPPWEHSGSCFIAWPSDLSNEFIWHSHLRENEGQLNQLGRDNIPAALGNQRFDLCPRGGVAGIVWRAQHQRG